MGLTRICTVLSLLLASPVGAQTSFLKMGPVTDGATEGALERVDGCLGGIAQKTIGGNWLCMPGDGPPTDTPLTCTTTLQGTRYFDLSMGQSCYCNGSAWCALESDVCGSATSCGTTAVTTRACPASWTFYAPSGPNLPTFGGTAAGAATAGRADCVRFVLPCSMTVTKMGMRVSTINATHQFDGAIYSNDGVTLLGSLGTQDFGATGNHLSTTLSAPLLGLTKYLFCWATSDAGATGRLAGIVGDATLGVVFTGTENAYVRGATATGNLAQFNANCTASVTPYACCTGNTTGTCPGFVNGLGALNNGADSGTIAAAAFSN